MVAETPVLLRAVSGLGLCKLRPCSGEGRGGDSGLLGGGDSGLYSCSNVHFLSRLRIFLSLDLAFLLVILGITS